MALRTPLHEWHVAHGGRMVDFAGWDMPVQYTSIVDEHQAVRGKAGLFDISHMGRLAFTGPDALAWIQHVYTNDAATLKDGQVRYGLVCNDAGGIRDDVLVYKLDVGYVMVVNASNREKIVGWLNESKGTFNANLLDRTLDTCMIAVQGPEAINLVKGLTEHDAKKLKYYFAVTTNYKSQPCLLSRTGYTGEDGVELIVDKKIGVTLWEELIGRGAKACGLGARDTLRLEAAMPLYGHELSEEIDPLQAGLGWAVKFDKGDFRGKTALLRRREDKSRRIRVGLELAGKRIAREGSALQVGGQAVGAVCSGTFSPTLQKTIAMGYVDPAYAAKGTAFAVDVRGKDESAVVVDLPFYKRAK
jgi:aminomethyltransferase